MWFCGNCKLVHHVAASYVVAAPTINDHVTRPLFDDRLYLKQCVSLIMPRFAESVWEQKKENACRSGKERESTCMVEEESMREKGEHMPGQPCSCVLPPPLLSRSPSFALTQPPPLLADGKRRRPMPLSPSGREEACPF
jgi:hypothetical protein